jgi:hypothetical protein
MTWWKQERQTCEQAVAIAREAGVVLSEEEIHMMGIACGTRSKPNTWLKVEDERVVSISRTSKQVRGLLPVRFEDEPAFYEAKFARRFNITSDAEGYAVLEELPEVRITASLTVWYVSDQTEIKVVRSPFDSCLIAVNDRKIDLPTGEVLELSSPKPGMFVVQMIDGRVWSKSPRLVLNCIADLPAIQPVEETP